MPVAISADGVRHEFPDGTDVAVIDRVMKQYAQQQAPPAQRPGMLSALGAGAKQGVGDILYGGAQIGARMGPEEGGAAFANSADLAARQQAVDRATTQREMVYGASPAVRAHPIIAGAGRLGGNIATTAPLAAIPGVGAALAGPASAAGRIGTSAALGAAQNLMQPIPMAPGRSFGGEKAGQAITGAIGGAAGGTLGEALSSTLGSAIAGNNTGALDRYLTGRYRQTIKPGRLPGPVGAPQLGMQDNRIISAVDSILENKHAIRLTDDVGNPLPLGTLPKNLRQFSEALDEGKRLIFQRYDQMAQNAGQSGLRVDVGPAAQMLREIADNPTNKAVDESLVSSANHLADNFARDGSYEPSVLQDIIKKLNHRVTKDFRAQGSSELKPVVDNLRASLDNAITSAAGPGYQPLKNQYGAIRSIERDVANAAQREAARAPWGSRLANAAEIGEAAYGLLTHEPKAIAAAVATEVGKRAIRYLNNPNRVIDRLFRQRAASQNATRLAIGQMIRPLGAPVGGVLGGRLAVPRPPPSLATTGSPAAAARSRDTGGDYIEPPPLRPSVTGP